MNDLTSSVFAQLDSSSIESIAAQLGIDPSQASNAIQQALPLLVGGLARNTRTPQGADALHSALERDHASVDLGGLLGSVLGGGSASGGGIGDILGSVLGGDSSSRRTAPAAGMGEAILGHIFGGRRERASRGLGQTSGLGSAGAAQLMAMLAPLVMAALGNMTRKQNMDSNALAGVLGQEDNRLQQSGVGGLLNGVLDTDGDGEISMSEMLQAGAGLMGALGRK
ncbi:DUF937 domain-containing protein [Dokdonella sp.]|uniref:DUF937 domain-containing protein n=1 Tax=Dokdonella sp. TaxID=2291710 RepID=UPI003527207B